MYLFNKVFEANISGVFAAFNGCHQVKRLAKIMLFNAYTSILFPMPQTFSNKRENQYILKETWIIRHLSEAIKPFVTMTINVLELHHKNPYTSSRKCLRQTSPEYLTPILPAIRSHFGLNHVVQSLPLQHLPYAT